MKGREYLLLTCEHGGNKIPSFCKGEKRIPQSVLKTHRGYDFGALDVAKRVSKKTKTELFFHTFSRLVLDYNRDPMKGKVWSEFSENFNESVKDQLLSDFFKYRSAIFTKASKIITKRELLHLAIHSFTPVRDGVVRNADVGILYDTRSKRECAIAELFYTVFKKEFKTRKNYPYLGKSDGLATSIRDRFKKNYIGFEMEFNYNILRTPKDRERVAELLVKAIGEYERSL